MSLVAVFSFGLLIITSVDASCQDSLLLRQLKQSQHLRLVMKPDSAAMGFTRWQKKKVYQSRVLPLATDFSALKIKGPGALKVAPNTTVSGAGSVVLDTPTSLAVKNPSNRSYAFAEMVRPLTSEDLSKYKRISVKVKLDAPGFYSA